MKSLKKSIPPPPPRPSSPGTRTEMRGFLPPDFPSMICVDKKKFKHIIFSTLHDNGEQYYIAFRNRIR